MQVRAAAIDWGEIDGPMLVFGGVCSNLHALQALEGEAARLHVPPANWICTGDAVAYCAHPGPVVARLRALGVRMVAGNVERQIAQGGGDCGCGFAEGGACDLMSARWFAHADAAMTPDDRAWMAALPDRAVIRHRGRRYAVIHGGARQVNRFVWPVTPAVAVAAEIDALDADLGPVSGRFDGVLAGHSGIAFVRRVAGRMWLNAGTLGMPPNDMTPRTEFALIDGDGRLSLRRLSYDHDAAARDMRAANLPEGCASALTTGIWPSEDILPPALRLPPAPS